MQIELPYPPAILNPNNSKGLHWARLSPAKKAFRWECFIEAKRQGVKPLAGPVSKLELDMTFYPPDRRHRDRDNALASAKTLIDGLADALGVNDRIFVIRFDMADEPLNKVIIKFN